MVREKDSDSSSLRAKSFIRIIRVLDFKKVNLIFLFCFFKLFFFFIFFLFRLEQEKVI